MYQIIIFFHHRALDLDDFKNTCGCEEYPLLRTINRVLRDYPGPHKNCKLEDTPHLSSEKPSVTQKPVTSVTLSTQRPQTQYTTLSSTKFKKPSTEAVIIDDLEPVRGCNSGVEYFPHESECSKYYVCMHGRPMEMK